MPSSSQQHELDMIRRPRVQITYDVETEGATEAIELPFVVGVLADLSGQPKTALPPLKDRSFVAIDRDNFDQVLERATPRLALKVQDRISGKDQKIAVELNFRTLEDFEPQCVAEQVAPLKELLNMRNHLTQLLGKMEGNDKLEQMLNEVLGNNEKALELAQQMGIPTTTEEAK